MLIKILTIVLSVAVFGVLLFLYIKKSLKKILNEYLLQNNNKKSKKLNN